MCYKFVRYSEVSEGRSKVGRWCVADATELAYVGAVPV